MKRGRRDEIAASITGETNVLLIGAGLASGSVQGSKSEARVRVAPNAKVHRSSMFLEPSIQGKTVAV